MSWSGGDHVDGEVLRHPAAVELVLYSAAISQLPSRSVRSRLASEPSMKSSSMPGWRSARPAMTRGIMIGASVL